MRKLWVNVGPMGAFSLAPVAASGAGGIRTTYRGMNVADGRRWLSEAGSLGLKRIMVLDNDAHAWGMARPWADGVLRAADEYGDLVDYWQPLNEPDAGWEPIRRESAEQRQPHHPSSWCMDPDEASAHLVVARHELGKRAEVIGPGLSSGHASYAHMVDWRSVDMIAIHPYGKWAGSPELDGMIRGYQALGKPIVVSEYDARTPAMHGAMSADDRIAIAATYCWSDTQNSELFGLVDERGKPKETYRVFAQVNVKASNDEGAGSVLEFKLGFKGLADELGADVVGSPTDNEHGATIQHTTTGIMVFDPDHIVGAPAIEFIARGQKPTRVDRVTALGDLWTAVRDDIPFSMDLAICAAWAEWPLTYGSPVGPQHDTDDGNTEQAFTRAIITWHPDTGKVTVNQR